MRMQFEVEASEPTADEGVVQYSLTYGGAALSSEAPPEEIGEALSSFLRSRQASARVGWGAEADALRAMADRWQAELEDLSAGAEFIPAELVMSLPARLRQAALKIEVAQMLDELEAEDAAR